MRLLPTWEKSPFTAKRASEHIPDVSDHVESPRRSSSDEMPSNFSPARQKQPIDLSYMIDANARQNVKHRQSGEFSSRVYNSDNMGPLSASTNPPRLDLSFTASPSLLDIFDDSKTMVASQPLEIRDGRTRNNEPPRQTSNSSSTGRSQRSTSSSRQSRPSSRSSIDDQMIPVEAFKAAKYKGPGDEYTKRQQQAIATQVAIVVKPSRNSSRPNSLPVNVVLNKISSTQRVVRQVELDNIVHGIRLLGSTQLPVPDASRSKRGAKLGNLMQAPAPIRSSFVLSNLPAVKPRYSTSENSEQAREVKPQEPANQMNPSSDEDATTTEPVLLKILQSLKSTKDLASTAMVNREFYRVFRLHERDLVNRILYATSLPAWELRYIMQGEQKRGAFKLRSFQRDVATIRALHSFIFMRCQHICRPSTIDALLEADTPRKGELDNALWRIWSFCRLFGKNRNHCDVKTQIAWLEGGGRHRKTSKTDMLGVGNGRGLTLQELEDLSEMWRCLKFLLEGFKGREIDARNAGIFDNCVIDEAENATEKYFLEIWIHELLCLGPKAVLTLNSCSFEQAKVLGVTKWTPPTRPHGKDEFFEAAVEEVYRERLVTEARLTATQFEKQMRARPIPARAASDYSTVRSHIRLPSQELRIVTEQFQPLGTILHQTSVSSGSPSLSSDCRSISPVSPSMMRNYTDTRPAAFSALSMTTAASTKLGSSLFPVQSSASSQISPRIGSDPISTGEEGEFIKPAVPDPVDKAMDYLVRELGFSEFKAKQALAMSDDGQGINVHKAVDLLMIGTESHAEGQSPIVAELPGVPISSPISTLSPKLSVVNSQNSTSSRDDMRDEMLQSGEAESCRGSDRFGPDTRRGDDYNLKRETHILNTMKAMCGPVHHTSTISNAYHSIDDAVKHDVQTGNGTSKYTIAGRRHSHRTTLSTGSVKFNPEELRLHSSIHPKTSLTAHPVTRVQYSTMKLQAEDGDKTPKRQPNLHQAPPRAMTTSRVATVNERKPSRGWSIKEAFRKREEQYGENIGYAL